MAIYAVTVTIGDKAKRDEARQSHRDYPKDLFDAGKLHESGPFVDDSGALLIYDVASEEELRVILDNDPYWQATGVIATCEINEWNLVFRRD